MEFVARRLSRVGLLLFLSVCAVIAQSNADQIASITNALRSRDFARALELLEPALRQLPANPQLWTLQGLAYSGEGHEKEALVSFHTALKTSPDYLPALEGAAQLEYQSGGREAEALLRHVLKLAPGDPTAHAMLAALAARQHKCSEAVAHFEQSGSVVETQPEALREYGVCLAKMKSYDKAIAVFQKLVTLQGDRHDSVRLAVLQLTAGRAGDAIQTLQPVLQHTPDSAALAVAAQAYEEQQDTPQAVNLLREAIVEDPQNLDLYLQFTDLAFVHQSFQVGIDMIGVGLKAQPKAAALYMARGILYVQIADYDHAEADFETANQLDPQLAVSEAARGMLAEQKDDLDKALSVVREKLSKRPNDPLLLYVLADILVQKNPDVDSPEFTEAVASANKAVKIQPGLVTARDTLAKLYLQAGKDQLAVDESRAALRYDANDQVALYHLIVGLRRTGQNEELPAILKRLAEARQKATREEGEHNRYKLVEPTQSSEQQAN